MSVDTNLFQAKLKYQNQDVNVDGVLLYNAASGHFVSKDNAGKAKITGTSRLPEFAFDSTFEYPLQQFIMIELI